MILGLAIAAVALFIDQLSKYWVLNHVLETYNLISLTSFFNIVNAWNTGVSFSMFSSDSYWGTMALCIIALAIIAALLWWLKGEESKLSQVALGLIIGGALGNVIDRVRLGAVFDFLDFYIADYHWPAFNAADTFISIGAVIIIVESFMKKTKKDN